MFRPLMDGVRVCYPGTLSNFIRFDAFCGAFCRRTIVLVGLHQFTKWRPSHDLVDSMGLIVSNKREGQTRTALRYDTLKVNNYGVHLLNRLSHFSWTVYI